MTDAVPAGWRNLVDWQRLVAGPLNKISQGYPYPSWDAEPAGTNEGYAFYDTVDHAPKWFDGTNYKTFAATDGLAGWTEIATSTPTGVSSVSFTGIPSTYSDLYLDIAALSHNSGSSQVLRAELSHDGSTWSGFPLGFTAARSASQPVYGGIFIPRYLGNQGIALLSAENMSANNWASSGGLNTWAWRHAGIQAIRLSFAGGNLDAGTVTLYGK